MIYTKADEIETVKSILPMFENKLPKRIINDLLTTKLRLEQHGLFFTLANPETFPVIKNALDSIRVYLNGEYFTKAVKKLYEDGDSLNHKAAVAEVIIFGYYCNKFSNNASIKLDWEKKINTRNSSIDITITKSSMQVNLEITGLHEDSNFRNHFDLRYKIKVGVTKQAEKYNEHKYSYWFSLTPEFTKDHINDFVSFVDKIRNNGVGKYLYKYQNKELASVEIIPLNKSNKEYATASDMAEGELHDDKRIKNKILEKASNQLPLNEINFICIPNLRAFGDDYDYETAFLGGIIHQIDLATNTFTEIGRKKDGIIHILSSPQYAPVYGLIHFKQDYNQKRILLNPFKNTSQEIIDLIS